MASGDLARARVGGNGDPMRDRVRELERRVEQLTSARQPTAGSPAYPVLIRQFNNNVALNGAAGTPVIPVSQTVATPAGYTTVAVYLTFSVYGLHDGTAGTATLTPSIDIQIGSGAYDTSAAVAHDITVINTAAVCTVSYSGTYTGLSTGTSVYVDGQTFKFPRFATGAGSNTAQLNGIMVFTR